MLKEDIIQEIKNKQLPVIICGAGIVGKVLLSICKDEGIKIECFCDSSKKVAQADFCGLEVIFTPDLKKISRCNFFNIRCGHKRCGGPSS